MTARKWDRIQQMTKGKLYDLEQRQGQEQRYNRRRMQDNNYRRRQHQPHQRDSRRRQNDSLLYGLKNILQSTKPTQDKKNDYKIEHKNQPNSRKVPEISGQLYRQQNAELKKSLDCEIQNYWRVKPREIPKQQKRQEIERESDDDQDDDDWLANKEDKDGKQTSLTDKKPEIMAQDDDFPQIVPPKPILQQVNYKHEQKKFIKQQIEPEKKEAKNLKEKELQKSEIINILEDVFSSDSQPQQQKKTEANSGRKEEIHRLSKLLTNQPFVVSQLPSPQKSKSVVPVSKPSLSAKSQQEIANLIEELSKQSKKIVYLRFQAEDNVLEFKIKQIDLVELAVTAKILSNGHLEFKKYPDIHNHDLQKFIRIQNYHHFFPRISLAQPETVHKAVEGQAEKLVPIGNIAQLKLCSIACSNLPIQKQAINKNNLIVRLVSVRCMQCDAKNKIPVLQDSNLVACSCHKCSAKIMGKIIQVRVEDY